MSEHSRAPRAGNVLTDSVKTRDEHDDVVHGSAIVVSFHSNSVQRVDICWPADLGNYVEGVPWFEGLRD